MADQKSKRKQVEARVETMFVELIGHLGAIEERLGHKETSEIATASMESRVGSLEARLGELTPRAPEFESRFVSLEHAVAASADVATEIGAIVSRVDALDARLSTEERAIRSAELASRLDTLEVRIDAWTSKTDDAAKRIGELERRPAPPDVGERTVEHDKRLATLEERAGAADDSSLKRSNALTAKVDSLEERFAELTPTTDDLGLRLQALEQRDAEIRELTTDLGAILERLAAVDEHLATQLAGPRASELATRLESLDVLVGELVRRTAELEARRQDVQSDSTEAVESVPGPTETQGLEPPANDIVAENGAMEPVGEDGLDSDEAVVGHVDVGHVDVGHVDVANVDVHPEEPLLESAATDDLVPLDDPGEASSADPDLVDDAVETESPPPPEPESGPFIVAPDTAPSGTVGVLRPGPSSGRRFRRSRS